MPVLCRQSQPTGSSQAAHPVPSIHGASHALIVRSAHVFVDGTHASQSNAGFGVDAFFPSVGRPITCVAIHRGSFSCMAAAFNAWPSASDGLHLRLTSDLIQGQLGKMLRNSATGPAVRDLGTGNVANRRSGALCDCARANCLHVSFTWFDVFHVQSLPFILPLVSDIV